MVSPSVGSELRHAEAWKPRRTISRLEHQCPDERTTLSCPVARALWPLSTDQTGI